MTPQESDPGADGQEQSGAKHWREMARAFWRMGFNVIPLGDDKRPIVTQIADNGKRLHWRWEDWQIRRQTEKDLNGILRPGWWADVRGIAGLGGVNDLVCIDFDEAGASALFLQQFLAELGDETAGDWAVHTPSGGRHVWLRCPGLILDKGKLDRPGKGEFHAAGGHIELRHTGHYTVLPGSRHPNGGFYQWHGAAPQHDPVTVAPEILLLAYFAVTEEPKKDKDSTANNATSPLQATTAPRNNDTRSKASYATKALQDEAQAVSSTPEGSHKRNARLNEAAFNLGQLVGVGDLDEALVRETLMAAAEQCGLEQDEAAATIDSGLEAGKAKPRPPRANSRKQTTSAANLDGDDVMAHGFSATTPDPATLTSSLLLPPPGTPSPTSTPTPDSVPEGEKPERPNSWPYGEKDGRLVYLYEVKGEPMDSRIADFTARNVEEITEEDGSRTFTILGSALRGGAFRLEINAEIIGQPRVLRALLESAAGAKDPVYPAMTEHLPAAIKLLTRDDELVSIKRFRRTGWHDGHFLMPGRQSDNKQIRVDLDRKLPYSFDCVPEEEGAASLAIAQEALTSLVNAIEPGLALTVLAQLLQAPLQRVAGWQGRYGIFIQGRTGSLKTSFCQTLMCLYGPRFAEPDLLLKWGEGATRNAIMSMAARAHDLPLLIDNYKPNTGGGGKDFVALIHNILEGGEKDRLNASSELRQAKSIHCFPLMTGEDVPDQDAASVARVLVLPFPWQPGTPNETLAHAQERSQHLQTLGSAWVDWLEDTANAAIIKEIAGQIWQRQRYWANELTSYKTGMANALRVAANLASNELAFQVALQCPALAAVLLPVASCHAAGLRSIAQTMASRTAEALEAHQFLGALRELIVTRQYILQPRALPDNDMERDRVLGWWDSDGVYLLPSLALSAAKRLLGQNSLPISIQGLYSQLEGLGKIASQDKGLTTKTLRIGGKAIRTLHLKLAAFGTGSNAEGDDEPEDDTPQILRELGL